MSSRKPTVAEREIGEVYERGRREGWAQALTRVQSEVLAGGDLARLLDHPEGGSDVR